MMPTSQFVLSKIEAGSRVRVIQDFFGREVVEIRPRLLPFGRRFQLPREDMTKVKVAIGLRQLGTQDHRTDTV